eukprot:COSAG06_NODE_1627_length_8882_cov_9.423659_8_plen_327_part_00
MALPERLSLSPQQVPCSSRHTSRCWAEPEPEPEPQPEPEPEPETEPETELEPELEPEPEPELEPEQQQRQRQQQQQQQQRQRRRQRQRNKTSQCGSYKPLPGGPPPDGARAAAWRRPAATARTGGDTAAARRLRASRAGRISTANYRPLPPMSPAGADAAALSLGLGAAEHGRSERHAVPQRVRFGDVLGLHCSGGQLTALDPVAAAATKQQRSPQQPAAKPKSQVCRWEIWPVDDASNAGTTQAAAAAAAAAAAVAAAAAAAGAEFEVHPSWEWSKQRTFSGAVRQVRKQASKQASASKKHTDPLPLNRVPLCNPTALTCMCCLS